MRTTVLVFLLCLPACSSSSVLLSEQMVGRWKMDKVIMDTTDDVTSEHNPQGNRYISFNNDQTFKSGGDPYGENTGRWTLDGVSGELFLDSDAGEEDDSHWIITIDGDQMRWQGTNNAFNSRFVIHHNRIQN